MTDPDKFATIRLEWHFTPPDYFEEKIECKLEGVDVVIDDGIITTEIGKSKYDRLPSLRSLLQIHLDGMFLGAQLINFRKYILSNSSVTTIYPDGKVNYHLEPSPATVRVSVGVPDIRITDKDGNVVSDTRQDRVERRRSLADRASAHYASDDVLRSLLRSHKEAIHDQANELVHLYEIPDALTKRFGSQSEARKELGISKADWNTLSALANMEPLRQGRHRGRALMSLRDATDAELSEARRIAHGMIEGYLRYLSTP